MGPSIEVNTRYSEDLIVQSTCMVDWTISCIRDGIVEKVINLQEDGIREALISLGWTPPKKFKMTNILIGNSIPVYFNNVDAPEWLRKGGRQGSTMDNEWFWNDHVMKLEVGQWVNTDLQKIERIS